MAVLILVIGLVIGGAMWAIGLHWNAPVFVAIIYAAAIAAHRAWVAAAAYQKGERL